jgi:hypothetical protein
MLVESIPASADPVLLQRVAKVPTSDPAQDYGAGSLPLEFSKNFGEKGAEVNIYTYVYINLFIYMYSFICMCIFI